MLTRNKVLNEIKKGNSTAFPWKTGITIKWLLLYKPHKLRKKMVYYIFFYCITSLFKNTGNKTI